MAALVPILFCVLLLPGFAQASSQSDPYGGYDDEPPEEAPPKVKPPAELIPRATGKPVRRKPLILVETLSGLTLGLVGIAPGVYQGFVLAASESSTNSDAQFIGVIGLSFVGVTAGSALGVWVSGSLMGGDGRFPITLVGAAVGALAGGFLAIPAASVPGGWAVPLLLGPVVGSVIAYTMSDDQEHEPKPAVAGTRLEMVPVISVGASGGFVAGLVGRF